MSSDFIKNIRQQQALGRISIAIDKEYFKIWLRTATPLLWIGCSDRVPANEIIGKTWRSFCSQKHC
jgi:hypothetical protein